MGLPAAVKTRDWWLTFIEWTPCATHCPECLVDSRAERSRPGATRAVGVISISEGRLNREANPFQSQGRAGIH